MADRIHVVGAGIAGLAAALAATRRGARGALYEAAPQAGGRCRTVRAADGFDHDNGTHVLFTANRAALGLLEAVGARADWIEPEPEGLPVYDPAAGGLVRIGLSPWSWGSRRLRPAGMVARDLLRLARLALPLGDRPVGSVMAGSALGPAFVEPLTVAVLNTPMEAASSRRLGRALRRLSVPGAARLLVARRGLGPDLVDPALRILARRGCAPATGRRLRGLATEGGRVTGLAFADRTVPVGPRDAVILALPPSEIARLLPGIAVPERFEPIVNLHFRIAGPDRPRFVGFAGMLAQWALVRGDHVSVTVSAAGAAADGTAARLADQAWGEIAPALRALGIAADPGRVPDARVVKERRATIRQAAGRLPQPPLRPLANLALAGDWIGTLPATIESAVRSAERAVAALGPGWMPARGLPRQDLVAAAGRAP
jgi:hypothetical protein